MTPLQLVLCCDGTSDDMLVPVVEWAFRQHLEPDRPINPTAVVAGTSLDRRIADALQSYPDCDLLVIHRDAERKGEAVS